MKILSVVMLLLDDHLWSSTQEGKSIPKYQLPGKGKICNKGELFLYAGTVSLFDNM